MGEELCINWCLLIEMGFTASRLLTRTSTALPKTKRMLKTRNLSGTSYRVTFFHFIIFRMVRAAVSSYKKQLNQKPLGIDDTNNFFLIF